MMALLYWCSWAFLALLVVATAWLGYLARVSDHE